MLLTGKIRWFSPEKGKEVWAKKACVSSIINEFWYIIVGILDISGDEKLNNSVLVGNVWSDLKREIGSACQQHLVLTSILQYWSQDQRVLQCYSNCSESWQCFIWDRYAELCLHTSISIRTRSYGHWKCQKHTTQLWKKMLNNRSNRKVKDLEQGDMNNNACFIWQK